MVDYLAFPTDTKFIASIDVENIMIVQSFETKKVVFNVQNEKVYSVVFCLNNERLVYMTFGNIFVIDKHYKKVIVLKIINAGFYLFLSEDNKSVLVTKYSLNWSGINAATCKVLFDNQNKKYLKNWRTKESKLRLFMLYPNINFS